MSDTTTKPKKFKHEDHPGVSFDLSAQQAADLLGWSLDRVRNHAVALGGVRQKWGDGFKRPASWRFPSKGIKTKAKAVEVEMKANQRNRRKASATASA